MFPKSFSNGLASQGSVHSTRTPTESRAAAEVLDELATMGMRSQQFAQYLVNSEQQARDDDEVSWMSFFGANFANF